MDPVTAILCAAIAGVCSIVVAWISAPSRKKIAETHAQLTVNHHASATPTALDKIDTLQTGFNRLEEKFDRHIEWHLEQM